MTEEVSGRSTEIRKYREVLSNDDKKIPVVAVQNVESVLGYEWYFS